MSFGNLFPSNAERANETEVEVDGKRYKVKYSGDTVPDEKYVRDALAGKYPNSIKPEEIKDHKWSLFDLLPDQFQPRNIGSNAADVIDKPTEPGLPVKGGDEGAFNQTVGAAFPSARILETPERQGLKGGLAGLTKETGNFVHSLGEPGNLALMLAGAGAEKYAGSALGKGAGALEALLGGKMYGEGVSHAYDKAKQGDKWGAVQEGLNAFTGLLPVGHGAGKLGITPGSVAEPNTGTRIGAFDPAAKAQRTGRRESTDADVTGNPDADLHANRAARVMERMKDENNNTQDHAYQFIEGLPNKLVNDPKNPKFADPNDTLAYLHNKALEAGDAKSAKSISKFYEEKGVHPDEFNLHAAVVSDRAKGSTEEIPNIPWKGEDVVSKERGGTRKAGTNPRAVKEAGTKPLSSDAEAIVKRLKGTSETVDPVEVLQLGKTAAEVRKALGLNPKSRTLYDPSIPNDLSKLNPNYTGPKIEWGGKSHEMSLPNGGRVKFNYERGFDRHAMETDRLLNSGNGAGWNDLIAQISKDSRLTPAQIARHADEIKAKFESGPVAEALTQNSNLRLNADGTVTLADKGKQGIKKGSRKVNGKYVAPTVNPSPTGPVPDIPKTEPDVRVPPESVAVKPEEIVPTPPKEDMNVSDPLADLAPLNDLSLEEPQNAPLEPPLEPSKPDVKIPSTEIPQNSNSFPVSDPDPIKPNANPLNQEQPTLPTVQPVQEAPPEPEIVPPLKLPVRPVNTVPPPGVPNVPQNPTAPPPIPGSPIPAPVPEIPETPDVQDPLLTANTVNPVNPTAPIPPPAAVAPPVLGNPTAPVPNPVPINLRVKLPRGQGGNNAPPGNVQPPTLPPNAGPPGNPTAPPNLEQPSLFSQLWNVPREAQTIGEVSFPGRQGINTLFNNPKEWARHTGRAVGSFFDENYANQNLADIKAHPEYQNYSDKGLALDDTGSNQYHGGTVLDKVPGVRDVIKRSKRSHDVAAGGMRLAEADRLVKDMKSSAGKQGFSDLTDQDLTSIMKKVNDSTGKGEMKVGAGKYDLMDLSKLSEMLGQVQYAPKFFSARMSQINPLNMIGETTKYQVDPRYTGRNVLADDLTKQQLKKYGTVAGLGSLGKILGLNDFSLDPRDTDFLKPKIKNTRFDFTGGEGGKIRDLVRMVAGDNSEERQPGALEELSSGHPLDAAGTMLGRGYKGAGKFVRNSLHPSADLLTGWATGKNAVGLPFDRPFVNTGSETLDNNPESTRFLPEIGSHALPLYWQQSAEAEHDLGLEKNIPASILGFLGTNEGSYSPEERKQIEAISDRVRPEEVKKKSNNKKKTSGPDPYKITKHRN